MRRSYLKSGDHSSVGGVVVEGMPFMLHHGTPVAFIGAQVTCPACKSVGYIAPRGPHLPDDLMGKHAALDGDICVCKCNPPPVMISSQDDMFQFFTAEDLSAQGYGPTGAPLERGLTDATGERIDTTSVQQPRGRRRPLTPGEIALARKVFADSIDYGRVEIRYEDYLPWQGSNYGITPNGNIYLGEDLRGISDFSAEIVEMRGFFVHEMTHVWQYQRGVNVLLVGAFQQIKQFLVADQYAYQLVPGKTLKDFNIEQQGDIVMHYYFALVGHSHVEKLAGLREALGDFPQGYTQ